MTTFPLPEEGGTYARLAMREAFSVAVDELERFLSRLTQNDARLVLEREADKWLVVDVANRDVVMLRTPDRLTAVKFMRAFAIQTDGATLNEQSISSSGECGADGVPSPDSTRLRLVL